MTPLVLLAAALLACAAVFKARTTARLGLGVSLLVVIEGATAIALLMVGLPGPFAGTTIARWSVPLAVVVLLLSSIDHGRRLKAVRDRRASTEGGRLAAFVKYRRVPPTGDAPADDRPDGL